MKEVYFIAGITAFVLAVKRIFRLKIKDIVRDLPRGNDWSYRGEDQITDITLHHSAADPERFDAYDYANWHIEKWGYGIAYHYVIDPDGTINQTNYLSSRSYHNGYNNTSAIGICLSGNFSINPMTDKQEYALIRLCKKLKNRLPSIVYFQGHKEYEGATECPGSMTDLEHLRNKVGLPGRNSGIAMNTLFSTLEFNQVKYDADN